MRVTFLLLVAINLTVLLWYTQIYAVKDTAVLPAIDKNIKQLVLVAEQAAIDAKMDELSNKLSQDESKKTAKAVKDKTPVLPSIEVSNASSQEPKATETAQASDSKEPVVEEQPQVVCYTLGPFKQLSRVKSAKKQLSNLGLTITQRSDKESELFGYRVYIDSYSSREEAIAATKKLAKNGITDYFVINDKEKRNGISLGLFRNKNGAIRRMAQVRRFDFKPEMEVRYRKRDIYWLDTQQTDDKLSDEVWREISEDQLGLQKLNRECS